MFPLEERLRRNVVPCSKKLSPRHGPIDEVESDGLYRPERCGMENKTFASAVR
jgi:hypothetical protein